MQNIVLASLVMTKRRANKSENNLGFDNQDTHNIVRREITGVVKKRLGSGIYSMTGFYKSLLSIPKFAQQLPKTSPEQYRSLAD
jgi:hypothetical protein